MQTRSGVRNAYRLKTMKVPKSMVKTMLSNRGMIEGNLAKADHDISLCEQYYWQLSGLDTV